MLRNIIRTILLSCIAFHGWAQDSSREKSVISNIREKIDVSPGGIELPQDSLKRKLALDSLRHSKWNVTVSNHKYDSIQAALAGPTKIISLSDTISKSISDLSYKAKHLADSLKEKPQQFLQQKIDSVKQPVDQTIDKVNSRIETASKPVEEKLDGLNQTVDQKTEKLQSSVEQGLDKATDGNVNVPLKDINGTEINLPTQKSIPGVGNSNLNNGITGDLPVLDIPNETLQISNPNLDIDKLNTKTNLKIPEANEVNKVKDGIGQVDSNLSEAEQYGKELHGLKKMDSSSVHNALKKVEDNVADKADLKNLEDQKQVLTKQQLEYNAMMQRYQDSKLLKAEIARKSRNVVNGKINKLTPEFKEVQEKFEKAKKLNADGHKLKDGKIKRENRMASKPLHERLVPGITIQVYNKNVFNIDWGVQLGYKLSSRLLVGAAGVFRTSVSEKYASWIKTAGVYSYRTYANFNVAKGFYIHGEFESLYVDSSIHPQTQAELGSQLVLADTLALAKGMTSQKKFVVLQLSFIEQNSLASFPV